MGVCGERIYETCYGVHMATRPIELSLVSYKILARLILMGILVSPDGRRTSSSKGSGWKQRKLCYRTLIVVVVTKIVIRATQPCSMMKDIADIPCELRVQHRAILLLFAARLCTRFHLPWFASPISMRDNIHFFSSLALYSRFEKHSQIVYFNSIWMGKLSPILEVVFHIPI